MNQVRVRVLGCGDAFGSGGRFQSCFMVTCGAGACLLDCGATALIAMRRWGIDPARIDAIFLSHLHGDHFAGLPFLLLQQHFVGRRDRPLVIAGPAGTEQRAMAALAVFFPSSPELAWRFPLIFRELKARRTARFGRFALTPYVVTHPSGSEAFAFRLKAGNRLIGYSGDTEWTDVLLEVARDADLFITECYAFSSSPPHHLNYNILRRHLDQLSSKRVLLAHMGQEMFERLDEVTLEVAEDGQLIEL
jgi:ribonuclease BN (tRNA processing enzyme)